jgi:hypothetical protein
MQVIRCSPFLAGLKKCRVTIPASDCGSTECERSGDGSRWPVARILHEEHAGPCNTVHTDPQGSLCCGPRAGCRRTAAADPGQGSATSAWGAGLARRALGRIDLARRPPFVLGGRKPYSWTVVICRSRAPQPLIDMAQTAAAGKAPYWPRSGRPAGCVLHPS